MISTRPTAAPPASSICIVPMPQLTEAIREDDDWTGITDAAARRRAQTRLNMRAYRKRKALLAKSETSSSSQEVPDAVEGLVQCWDTEKESTVAIPASRLHRHFDARKPLLPQRPRRHPVKLVFPLCPDNLITLLQYNALRGLAVNRSLISGILVTPLDCGEETVHVLPYPLKPELVPKALLPTALQQTVPHGDWIDLWPTPEGRDRLIRATGTFDEDDLWSDCIGGLFEGFPDDEMKKRGMIAWSPPWEISGWEMSEGFVRKWGWLIQGIQGPLEATNRWRRERQEEPLTPDHYVSHPSV